MYTVPKSGRIACITSINVFFPLKFCQKFNDSNYRSAYVSSLADRRSRLAYATKLRPSSVVCRRYVLWLYGAS